MSFFETIGNIFRGGRGLPAPSFDPGRVELDRDTGGSTSQYGGLVRGTNTSLDFARVPIHPSMRDSIARNVREVDDGTIHQPTAHLREAAGFARRAGRDAWDGKWRDAGWSATGSILNGAAFLLSGSRDKSRYNTGQYRPGA